MFGEDSDTGRSRRPDPIGDVENERTLQRLFESVFDLRDEAGVVDAALDELAPLPWLRDANFGIGLTAGDSDCCGGASLASICWRDEASAPTFGACLDLLRSAERGTVWAADAGRPSRRLCMIPIVAKDVRCGGLFVSFDADEPSEAVDLNFLRRVARIIAHGLEISRRESELIRTKTLLETTMNVMDQGIAVYDERMTLQTWSKNFERIMDLPPGWVRQGLSIQDYIRMNAERGEYGAVDLDKAVDERLRQLRADLKVLKPHKYVRRRPGERYVEITGRPMPEGGLVTTFVDITTQHKAQMEVERLAWTDPLTGLNNRNSFRSKVQSYIEAAEYNESGFALMIVDLDRFKPINDTYGHDVGDAVLKIVSRRIRRAIRAGDAAFRLGGDEFAVILEHGNDSERVVGPLKRLMNGLMSPMHVDGRRLNIGASIGVAFFPDDDRRVDELMRKADLALYEAKTNGRGEYKIYDAAVDQKARRARRIEDALREAIEGDELELYFQPLVSTQTGVWLGAEALLRWNHSERGLVSPGEFVPIAEQSGLVFPLGSWVLRRAWAALAEWMPIVRASAFRLSFNVSPRQFFDAGFVQLLKDLGQSNPEMAARIDLEITEEVMLKRSEEAMRIMTAVRELGFGVAIDDFGTGYSSFSYLNRLPAHKLKIDRSFVFDLERTPSARAIVDAIVALSHKLGMSVVAEGVETNEQASYLRSVGCDEFQGYFFARPMSQGEFERQLSHELSGNGDVQIGVAI